MLRSVSDGKNGIEYTLIQTVRKSVRIEAQPEGVTRVFAPKYMRLKDIDALVEKKIPEILRLHAALDQRLASDCAAHPMTEGSPVCVEGKALALHLKKGVGVSARFTDSSIEMTMPDPENEKGVRMALRNVLSELAMRRIRERLTLYAPRISTDYGRVTIREQRTRWGSCSSKRNLNFNWKLIQAPPEALDYVVIHELCHLIEFNHSPRFWSLVEKQMPAYKAWKKWLKDHGAELGI